MLTRLLFPLFFLSLLGSHAQNASTLQLSASPTWGFLAAHHPEMEYLAEDHIYGFELEIAKTTDGSKNWHHYYNFPTWGFSFNFYDLGSRHLGNCVSGRIFFDLPLNQTRSIGLKMGFGAGYVQRPFNLEDNYNNSAIGSHLNASISLDFYYHLKLSKSLSLKPGIGLHHLSNGANQLPNSGINLATCKLLLAWKIGDYVFPERLSPPFDKGKHKIMMGLSGGRKQVSIPFEGRQTFNIFNFFIGNDIRLSPKSSIGGELGLNYNPSLEYRAENESKQNNYRPYLAFSYQLNFDPLAIRFQLGHYVFNEFEGDGNIFLRYHLVRNFNSFQVFAGLKSHWAKADNVEIGLNYFIFQK